MHPATLPKPLRTIRPHIPTDSCHIPHQAKCDVNSNLPHSRNRILLSGDLTMSTNGAATSKRKRQESSVEVRPNKQLKTDSPSGSESEGMDMIDEDGDLSSTEAPRLLPLGNGGADSKEWQQIIESVIRDVVSIRFCQTCSFDTESAVMSEATGFVVDAERGIIMTNRHVACPGPFWGYCVFDNHEECDVHVIYRDPVHDFGLLQFNPKDIKYMPVSALKLRPDLATVGTEIRVVGNDAGEKLSILSGVISRIDRNAPDYGSGYNDFNTNYIQAAASATGGSSGSPVVSIEGYAVALQAGGSTEAATDYFLPLDRPLRALKCIQEGKPITRGTIQTQWYIKPFDECRRLGLQPEWEDQMRTAFPKEIGLLVSEVVLPEGPGFSHLEEGDVLLKVNDELLTRFIRLDEILDSSVGGQVKLLVSRGGTDCEFVLNVQDLHSITPDRFLSVCGAGFHDLSYQQARLYAIACKGVYVCEPSGSFRFESTDKGWVIVSIDHKDTPDLKTFIEVIKSIPDRARVVVTYRHLGDLHTLHTFIVHIDRHWQTTMRMAVRNDSTGLWDFHNLSDPIAPEIPERRKANFPQLRGVPTPEAAEIIRSFVRISCAMPLKLDGFPRARKIGFGLVIDAEKGLVIVSRAIVPYDLCDITVTIAESIIVDGKVVFMHPLQNYVVIKYDPSLVDAPVKSAKLSTELIDQGASTIFVGFNQNLRAVAAKTTVTDVTTVAVPSNPLAPRYRALNVDAISVDSSLGGGCGSGVLISEAGIVQALWLTYLGERQSYSGGSYKDIEYHLGLATPTILPVLNQIQDGRTPHLRILNAELHTVQMSQARTMGLSEEWIRKVEQANPDRHQLFMVRKIDCGRAQTLKESDLILSINDHIMTRISDLDVMYTHETLKMHVLRRQEELTIDVTTVPTEDVETDRALLFCGAVLHRPHHAVRQQISKLHSEIYISARSRGSPAYQYNLVPTNFILAVNGRPTTDLDSFLAAVNIIPDNTYFRIRMMSFDTIPYVITIKKNEHYVSWRWRTR